MITLLDYFQAAFLINLPERTDRLRSAKKELAEVGWKIGTAGLELYPARKFTDRAGFPSVGTRGCTHSHLECLRRAHLGGRRNVLLLEDDIAFASSLPRLTPLVLSQLECKNWDFIYFGHEGTGEIGTADSGTREVSLVPPKTEIITTHFYGVNGRILPRLLEHLNRIVTGTEGDQEYGPMPIDGAFNIFRRKNSDVQTLIANPKLGWQRPSRSDILPRSFDSLHFFRPLTTALRELKHLANRMRS